MLWSPFLNTPVAPAFTPGSKLIDEDIIRVKFYGLGQGDENVGMDRNDFR